MSGEVGHKVLVAQRARPEERPGPRLGSKTIDPCFDRELSR